jgi:para-nitrobenzyl esterase
MAMVVVNVNHRLNVLGYAHARQRRQFVSSSSVAFSTSNLRALGEGQHRRFGRSQRVLILASPAAAAGACCGRCRRRAACSTRRHQSSATRRLRSVEDGVSASKRLLTITGLRPNPGGSWRLPLAQLMAANFELAKKPALPGAPNNFAPVYDNRVVTRQPFDPVANPLNADIPLIVGCTSTENTAFMMGDAAAFRLDMAGLRSRMRALIGERAGDAADLYVQLKPGRAVAAVFRCCRIARGGNRS